MYSRQISLFFHNYYGDDLKWLDEFQSLDPLLNRVYYNTVESSVYRKIYADAPEVFDHLRSDRLPLFVFKSSNLGKDIGGKLIMIDAAMRMNDNSKYWLFFHDKRSPYHEMGRLWLTRLKKLIDPETVKNAIDVFTRREDIGIVCLKDSHRIEQKKSYLETLKEHISVSCFEKLLTDNGRLPYASSTMFLTRSELYKEFFQNHPPIVVRESLEGGDVKDDNEATRVHAWERMFTWIAVAKNYKIATV